MIIAGPTAAGNQLYRWRLPILLTERLYPPIPCRYTEVWTSDPQSSTTEKMQGIKHHMIDILDPEEDLNVSSFPDMAAKQKEI